MSYIVNKTDGNVLATLLDGTTNTDTGLTLIGRNFTSYGEIQNENFVRLLENFAAPIPPGQSVGFNPIIGTLWWDTGNQLLKVFNGSSFVAVSQRAVSSTAPTTTRIGDQWWNTNNNQLSVWSGTEWLLIGPAYSTTQGKTGAIVESITDNFGNVQTVINNYVSNALVSITCGNEFIPQSPIPGFEVILRRGINLSNVSILNGTANNSIRVGSLYANVFSRLDIDNQFNQNNFFNGNIVIGNNTANVFVNNNNLLVKNTRGGNIDLYVGNQRALNINGATGIARVAHSPVADADIANKGYVDQTVNATVDYIQELEGQIKADVDQVLIDYQSNIVVVVNATNANLNQAVNGINSTVNNLNTAFLSNVGIINSNLGVLTGNIGTLSNITATKANINSPTFTGNPVVPPVEKLLTYFRSLGPGLNPYQISLSDNIGVKYGDIISQLDSHTLVTLANLQVHDANVRGNVVNVTITSGSITTGIQPFQSSLIEINGQLIQPAVWIEKIAYLGPDIAYRGIGDYSGTISTTMYVDTTANLLYTDYNAKITNIKSVLENALAVAVAPLAPKDTPVFTGVPTAPTPASADNSQKIATTQYVQSEITSSRATWMGSKYVVSTSQPTGGDDGDFWFVIG